MSRTQITKFSVTVPVTTVATSIYDLVKAYFTANRPSELNESGNLDFTVYSRVRYTVDPTNTANISVGDADATCTASGHSEGTVLSVSEPAFIDDTGSDTKRVDLTKDFAVAAANTQYLNVRASR